MLERACCFVALQGFQHLELLGQVFFQLTVFGKFGYERFLMCVLKISI
jgi:hypothetical protein